MKYKAGSRRRAVEYEKALVEWWKKNKTFERSVEQRPIDQSYVFYDGPPFITGNPHHGTLLSSVVKDAVPRFWTMRGYRVERRWGWDCHGLPAENFTEKHLGGTVSRTDDPLMLELKVGDEVEAVILTLDREERKMSLGIKQLKPDPWETIEEKYPIGSKHVAKVRNFTNFGVFVEIEEGVDGLIHISDLSWTKKIKHPSEFTQIGADIEVQVLEIDKENRRLSLGHKQLEENPWDVFETVFTVGSVHEGTIIEMLDKGAVIALPYGVEGFATPKHLVKEDGTQAQVDEKLPFKVIEFNKDAKRIILSHSRIFEDAAKAEEKAEKKAAKKENTKKENAPIIQNQAASTTLGDIDALAALKEQMEGKK